MKFPCRRGVALLFFLVLFLLTTGAAVYACLNDRDSDSLIEEARDLPELTHIITGRFERNPPLFYEMRLKRVAKEIDAAPDNLSLYDDAAVACDRLGRQDEAIAWITKKHLRLERKMRAAGQSDALATKGDLREHWYRYHANIGTFLAHQWIKDGADRKHMERMKAARDHIARALELKPDAHFGREKYQLWAMEWIIHPAMNNDPGPVDANSTDPLHGYIEFKTTDPSWDAQEAITGLSGLVVLGNAWESVDVFAALGYFLEEKEVASLSYLARLRAAELIDKGRRSLNPGIPPGKERYHIDLDPGHALEPEGGRIASEQDSRPQAIERAFRRMRQRAEAWHKRRTEFMLKRLKAGQHPDTHPDFWAGFEDSKPPTRLEQDASVLQSVAADTKPAVKEQVSVARNADFTSRFVVGAIVFVLCLIVTPLVLLYLRKRRGA